MQLVHTSVALCHNSRLSKVMIAFVNDLIKKHSSPLPYSYELFVLLIHFSRIILQICEEVESSIRDRNFLREFKTSGLPMLSDKLDKFLDLLVSPII